mmetsp:Transcript_38674/g.70416  ORF Transcript_38674/g.70416 Transcript_38674/m.70416 type:complete len:241 (+) Transcript_38674:59-781(+)
MGAALGPLLASEAALPCLAASLGVAAAGAFITTSAGTTPAQAVDDDDGVQAEPADAQKKPGAAARQPSGAVSSEAAVKNETANSSSGEGASTKDREPSEVGVANPGAKPAAEATGAQPTAAGRQRPKFMTAEQEAAMREKMASLSPETREKLEAWNKMCSEDTGAMLALYCLAVLLFAALLVSIVAYLIGFHKINLLSLETWKDPMSIVTKIIQDFSKGRPAGRRTTLTTTMIMPAYAEL